MKPAAVSRAAVMLCVTLTLPACGDRPSRTGDAALHADVEISPTPASMADTRVTVTIRDGGRPATDATADLRAEGPGSPISAPLEKDGDGRFRAGPLRFDAPGRWVLIISVETAQGRRAVFRQPVQVSGRGR